MNVYVGQIYIEPGVKFPFSIAFQQRISAQLTELVDGWGKNTAHYSDDFDLIFRLSSKSDIEEVEIRGPTIFKRDKSVEYSIFIPFKLLGNSKLRDYYNIIICLIDSIRSVFFKLGIDDKNLQNKSLKIAGDIVNDPEMFSY